MSWTQSTLSNLSSQPKKKHKRADDDNHKFIKPAPPSLGKIKWQTIKPQTKEELVVHKKKIEEVQNWLESLHTGDNSSRILLITGPPGCGKLTTVEILCKSLKLGLTEWVNPIPMEYDPDHTVFYTSQLKAFTDFILRATRYKSLLTPSYSKRVILIKDLPNVFIRDKTLFHECVKEYLSVEEINIIFIISETSLAKELFTEELKCNRNIQTINFNPITQKSIEVALRNISRKLGANCEDSSKYITEVSHTCNGDLRNAIQTLVFLTPQGNHKKPDVTKKEVQGAKGRRPKTESYFSHLQSDTVPDIFHGLGRTLYPKRDDSGKLLRNPFEVASSYESSPGLFVNMLHENYLNTFSDLHSVTKAADSLALSDLFLSQWGENEQSKVFGLSSVIYSLMLHNESPIKRFQQFNKYKNAENSLSTYRGLITNTFGSLDVLEYAVDRFSYLRRLPTSGDDNQKKILKEFSYLK